MIDINHKYQTRGDERVRSVPVRILCVDGPGEQPVVGIAGTSINTWSLNGTYFLHPIDESERQLMKCHDLIPVPTKHEGWVAISNEGWVCGQYAGDRLKAGGLIDRKMAEYIAHVTWED